MRAEYLLLMAACLLVTLPLEFRWRARVYRRPVRLLLALAPVVVFLVWDAMAIARGHWSFDPERTSGVLLPGSVPLEELVFFLVVPLCGLLTYEAVGTVLSVRAKAHPGGPPRERRGGPSGSTMGDDDA
jgi:lycopene cyclase domain-containing protein